MVQCTIFPEAPVVESSGALKRASRSWARRGQKTVRPCRQDVGFRDRNRSNSGKIQVREEKDNVEARQDKHAFRVRAGRRGAAWLTKK
jgi:hypothetical protein